MIKKYKVFLESLKNDIEDVFLELEDEGYIVDIIDLFKAGKSKSDPSLSTYGMFKDKFTLSRLESSKKKIVEDYICIRITKHQKYSWNDILEYVDRIIDLLENYQNYKLYQFYISKWKSSGNFHPDSIKEINKIINYYDNNEIEEVKIYFKEIK